MSGVAATWLCSYFLLPCLHPRLPMFRSYGAIVFASLSLTDPQFPLLGRGQNEYDNDKLKYLPGR